MMQILDYEDIRDAVINTLKTANTTTAAYDLSNNLETRIFDISARDLITEPLMLTEYPYISVTLSTKTEEQMQFGGGETDNEAILSFEVYCIYDSGDKAATDDNLLRMIRNTETNLKADLSLGSYNTLGASVVNIVPTDVAFKEAFNNDSPYNKSSRIDVNVTVQLTNV